ncbi:MAG: hypothetical protein ACE5F5_05755 [Acidimicrobiia bacterium]
MFNERQNDEEFERLLSGALTEDSELASFVARLRRLKDSAPSDEQVHSMAAEAAAIVRETLPAQSPAVPRRRLVPRLAGALAALVLLVGMTGVAVASDASVPGDPLYGIDRALEAVGLGNGGAVERLQEAKTLANRGKSAEALEHASSALAAAGDKKAAEALKKAAKRVVAEDKGGGKAEKVKAKVSDMLNYIANSDTKGREFGQQVAKLARQIGDGNSNEEIPPADDPPPADPPGIEPPPVPTVPLGPGG